ncbi:Predicted helicase [Bartonella vinsonii]|uniref:Predicted helicase n=1 Tax=Bartonella vinsonii TaxID=33047 RepID=A0A3S5C0W9_BARVI|nr:Predicted helicase [Bartonella vinsonii]
MDKILKELDKTNIEEESKDLREFYDSVKLRASGITTPQARQNLIITLYESFFAKAFKTTTDRLGIVYTPVEVVDFIIHSVDDVLRKEFARVWAPVVFLFLIPLREQVPLSHGFYNQI